MIFSILSCLSLIGIILIALVSKLIYDLNTGQKRLAYALLTLLIFLFITCTILSFKF